MLKELQFMKMRTTQGGIGLLELMLAMAIMAILIIVSIQYFQSTKNATYMNAAVQEIQTIMATTNGITNPARVAGNNGNGGDPDTGEGGDLTKSVILSGSIPKTYIDGDANNPRLTGPWGKGESDGTFILTYHMPGVHGDKAYVNLSGQNLPNYACESLVEQFKHADNVAQGGKDAPPAPECKSSKKLFLMNFYLASGNSIDIKK